MLIRRTVTEPEIRRRRSAVDGREIVAAIREGRLTRHQFDAWHELRRRTSGNIVITLRDSKPRHPSVRKHRGRR